MPLYAAHAPAGPPSLESADRVRLIPQGFSWPAFLFGPWWLALRGLWRALIVWAVVNTVLIGGATAFGAHPLAIGLAQTLIGLYLGLEAPALLSAAAARSGRPMADLLAAPDEESALAAFFVRWLGEGERPAAPASATAPATPSSPRQPVLGLFPEPGGRA